MSDRSTSLYMYYSSVVFLKWVHNDSQNKKKDNNKFIRNR